MPISKTLKAALMVCALLPVLVFAYLGIYSRYMADDFCIINDSLGKDLIGETIFWYNTWGGRLSQPLTLLPALELGPGFVPVAPALVLVLWSLALCWAIYQLALLVRLDSPGFIALFGGNLLLAATLVGTPQIGQSLYWLTAVLAYTFPLVLIALLAGMVMRTARLGRASIPLYVFTLILAFFIGSFSEPIVTFAGAAFGLAMLAAFWFRAGRPVQIMLVMAVLGLTIALVVMVAAPGNQERQALFGEAASITETISNSIIFGIAFVAASIMSFAPGITLAVLVISALIAHHAHSLPVPRQRTLLLALVLWTVAGIAVLIAYMLPGVYGTSAPPPARSLIIPQFGFIITVAGIGYVLGLLYPKPRQHTNPQLSRLAFSVLLVMALIGPMFSAWQFIRLMPIFTAFAAEYDHRDQVLRAVAASGETGVIVPRLTTDLGEMSGLETVTEDPEFWVNRCVARYYGLETLIAEQF